MQCVTRHVEWKTTPSLLSQFARIASGINRLIVGYASLCLMSEEAKFPRSDRSCKRVRWRENSKWVWGRGASVPIAGPRRAKMRERRAGDVTRKRKKKKE